MNPKKLRELAAKFFPLEVMAYMETDQLVAFVEAVSPVRIERNEPLQRGDTVKLKESQQVVIGGQRVMLVIPAGERAVFIGDGPVMGGLAVIELADLQHGPMRVIVKLSNLERA